MRMIDYLPEHLMLLDLQDGQRHIIEGPGSLQDYAEFLLHGTISPKTILVGGEVVAIVSVYITGIESGELTSLLSKRIRDEDNKRYYFGAFKKAREYVNTTNIYRLEARVDPRVPAQIRLVEFLGLEFEAILEGAGHGRSDLALYKRLQK